MRGDVRTTLSWKLPALFLLGLKQTSVSVTDNYSLEYYMKIKMCKMSLSFQIHVRNYIATSVTRLWDPIEADTLFLPEDKPTGAAFAWRCLKVS